MPNTNQAEQKPVEEKTQNEVKLTNAPADLLKKADNQPEVSAEEKIWGVICYIPLMALLALVINPRSEYIKLHGRQGLLITILFFFDIILYLVPVIGIFLGMILHIAAIVLGIFSAIQALVGNWWKIPVLGAMADLIPIESFTKVARDASMGAKVDEMDKDAELLEKEKAEVAKSESVAEAKEQPVSQNSEMQESGGQKKEENSVPAEQPKGGEDSK